MMKEAKLIIKFEMEFEMKGYGLESVLVNL